MLLLVVAAAGLAGEHATVETLSLAVHQELEGLQAADAQRVGQFTLRPQQLLLRVLFLDLGLQVAVEHEQHLNSTSENLMPLMTNSLTLRNIWVL